MLSVICFGVGTIIGGCIGFVVCALCLANKGDKKDD